MNFRRFVNPVLLDVAIVDIHKMVQDALKIVRQIMYLMHKPISVILLKLKNVVTHHIMALIKPLIHMIA